MCARSKAGFSSPGVPVASCGGMGNAEFKTTSPAGMAAPKIPDKDKDGGHTDTPGLAYLRKIRNFLYSSPVAGHWELENVRGPRRRRPPAKAR